MQGRVGLVLVAIFHGHLLSSPPPLSLFLSLSTPFPIAFCPLSTFRPPFATVWVISAVFCTLGCVSCPDVYHKTPPLSLSVVDEKMNESSVLLKNVNPSAANVLRADVMVFTVRVVVVQLCTVAVVTCTASCFRTE